MFFKFEADDIVDTIFVTNPRIIVGKTFAPLSGVINPVFTGSVVLEKPYLDDALNLRIREGLSEKEGGLIKKIGPFSASIDFVTATRGGTNGQYFAVLEKLCDYYKLTSEEYSTIISGSAINIMRIINIPEVMYDKQIATGSVVLEDEDYNTSKIRRLADDGKGNLVVLSASGTVAGDIVGKIFYQEGIAFLGVNGQTNHPMHLFGGASTNYRWKFDFRGVHRIPTQIFKCRAPAGELNASTNRTFSTTAISGTFKNSKVAINTGSFVYVTTVGLYSDQYELVGLAKLAQPIKKSLDEDILFRILIDR